MLGGNVARRARTVQQRGSSRVDDFSHIATMEFSRAPNSIDHFHEVLNAVMRTALIWYGLERNPARGVQMGRIKPVRKKWALTPVQANALLEKLTLKARTMVVLNITTGLGRGE